MGMGDDILVVKRDIILDDEDFERVRGGFRSLYK